MDPLTDGQGHYLPLPPPPRRRGEQQVSRRGVFGYTQTRRLWDVGLESSPRGAIRPTGGVFKEPPPLVFHTPPLITNQSTFSCCELCKLGENNCFTAETLPLTLFKRTKQHERPTILIVAGYYGY